MKVLALEYDLEPLYLCPKSLCAKENGLWEERHEENDNNLFESGCYALMVNGFSSNLYFAENVQENSHLQSALKSLPGCNFSIITTMSFTVDQSGNQTSYTEGFALLLNKDDDNKKIKENLIAHLDTNRVKFNISRIFNKGNTMWYKEYSDNDSLQQEIEVVAVKQPKCHPAYNKRETNSVYHDQARVQSVLDTFKSMNEVQELKEIYDGKMLNIKPLKRDHPIIVIEGLDATGKSTLTENLAKRLNGCARKSPQDCVLHLRKTFDSHFQLLRRAYYAIGNYAFAAQVLHDAQSGPVVCDRFWHSTAAYAIATDVKVGDETHLPPARHWVYSWPPDLLKPDIVILLTISDELRRCRLEGRNTEKTDEEIRMEKSRLFRQRIAEVYKRMDNPALVELDASGSAEELCNKAVELLSDKHIITI
uniref:UMP-CMP kinase 2, mitochondrial n=1 Tax=Ciona intestinalis TaxID=7719 RepID=F6TFV0_CIOIN|nr:UMP-CMP kinase 2, mitochondrial-like [Ciona intestinalis]|eukprot:XP_002124573.1 UMP-CMP kinase 2, mitochondrial-like [Ciona intestinalis]